jgi:hypothetical protein
MVGVSGKREDAQSVKKYVGDDATAAGFTLSLLKVREMALSLALVRVEC